MRKSFESRLRALESRLGKREPPPTLFVIVTDTSLPDPDQVMPVRVYSDSTLVGFYGGPQRGLIERLPGESVRALQARLERTLPDVRVFMAAYAHDETAAAP